MEREELNQFTKYDKFSSPFVKDDKFINTKELCQDLPSGKYIITEKIDGTNIRIILNKPREDGSRDILFGSRKMIFNDEDKSSYPYLECLKEVNVYKLAEYFKDVNSTIIIYGEGYGAGIQKGGIYSPIKNFRVFDIRIGKAYQDWSFVEKVCIDNQLNIVPLIGTTESISYDDCLLWLSDHKSTIIKEGCGGDSEGLVFKFEPVLLNKYGERLIFKVKHKDFKQSSNNTEVK